MDFLLQSNNLLLIAVIVVSAIALLLPALNRRGTTSISAAQAIKLINEQKAQVIDLRGAAEFKRGHITKARNIPADQLAKSVNGLDKERPILLVDQSGSVARMTTRLFTGLDFKQVYILDGGIDSWKKENFPLV